MSRAPSRRGTERDPVQVLLDDVANSGQMPSATELEAAVPTSLANYSSVRRQVEFAAGEVAALKRDGRNGDARNAAREHAHTLAGQIGERPPVEDPLPSDPRSLAAMVRGDTGHGITDRVEPDDNDNDPRTLAAHVARKGF